MRKLYKIGGANILNRGWSGCEITLLVAAFRYEPHGKRDVSR